MTSGQRDFLENSTACFPACGAAGAGAANGAAGTAGAAGALGVGGQGERRGTGDPEIDGFAKESKAESKWDRAWKQLGRLLSKSEAQPAPTPTEFQYALVATRNGAYPDVRNGVTMMTAGEVWKYGTTADPAGRYSATALSNLGLQMIVQTAGNAAQVLTQEKIMLIQYHQATGTLPPGNYRFK